jgi:hypothetical protein
MSDDKNNIALQAAYMAVFLIYEDGGITSFLANW